MAAAAIGGAAAGLGTALMDRAIKGISDPENQQAAQDFVVKHGKRIGKKVGKIALNRIYSKLKKKKQADIAKATGLKPKAGGGMSGIRPQMPKPSVATLKRPGQASSLPTGMRPSANRPIKGAMMGPVRRPG